MEFPSSGTLSSTQIKTLEAVLPPRPALRLTGEEEEVTLTTVDPSSAGSDDGHPMDEDEGEGGARRVQCQNM